ncbi:hypothetical protein SB6419_01112 [Klebsiella spallanzanii]|nr:hypothetical protein SB6419_01112 [Klebsiella spallanzanii]
MLNKYVDIARLIFYFQGVKYIGVIGAQVFFDKIT